MQLIDIRKSDPIWFVKLNERLFNEDDLVRIVQPPLRGRHDSGRSNVDTGGQDTGLVWVDKLNEYVGQTFRVRRVRYNDVRDEYRYKLESEHDRVKLCTFNNLMLEKA
jgi:hypothetical protein